MECHMCGSEDPNPSCDSCLKIVCQDCCLRCKICDLLYCDDCIFDFKVLFGCSNHLDCDNNVCYKCYSFSDNHSDILLCDECIQNSGKEAIRCYSYMFYRMNPEKNTKKRRISKDPLYYDCKEQGPNLVDGVTDLVFSFLSDKDKLLNISLVCKHYRNVLMRNTNIWMHGDGQTIVTQPYNMLFIHNIPTTKIRFSIQCVGLSLKIINYLLRNEKDIDKSYWPKTIHSFRCTYAIEVVKRLFGSDWKWKTGFTEHLTGNFFHYRREELYTQCAIEHVYDMRIWKLFTLQNLSAFISNEDAESAEDTD